MKTQEKELDDKKIAFIICANDEQELTECFYYLNHLIIPDGYEIEVLTISEASSMASGYNEAMNSSNAKYKVYLHQDVFIINSNFLLNVLSIFQNDEEVGIIGCVGCRHLPANAYAITSWDVGKVLHNCTPNSFVGYQDDSCAPVVVDAVDGLLMITQYDIPWREDIFDGWDFYDISQCFEFHKMGKKVVVPYQESAWCYHDNRYSKMGKYHIYRRRFISEYSDILSNSLIEEGKSLTESYEELREKAIGLIEELIDGGKMEEVCILFQKPDNQGVLAFKEYELLAEIYRAELKKPEKLRLYKQGVGKKENLRRLRNLKYLVKRIEFEVGNQNENMDEMMDCFTKNAIEEVTAAYCVDVHKVLTSINNRWQV